MGIPERIKEIRADLNKNQSEFAEYIGVSGAAVSMWETEKTTPDSRTLEIISLKCGVRRSWLERGELPKRDPTEDLLMVTRAMTSENENKKKLMRILADMPDDLLDKMMEYLESKLK